MAKKMQLKPLIDYPYAGLCVDGDTPVEHLQPHLLVSGMTGSGKTRTVLSTSLIRWNRRPAVVVSCKGDFAELTAAKRARQGPVYVMDLSGLVDFSEITAPVTRVFSDPTALVYSDDTALDLADLLINVKTVDGGSDSFWKDLARPPLAAILRAAAGYIDPHTGVMRDGGGIAWALDAAQVVGETPDPDGEIDYTTPSWQTAIARCQITGSRHGRSLASAAQKEAQQRDSIAINLDVALGTWQRQEVREPQGAEVAFHPRMLEEGAATLFIISPDSGDAAPAATATITAIVEHWRRRNKKTVANLLMVIDELPSSAPLPKLAIWVGTLRGEGVRIVAAVQASSQFAPRWGAAGLKILRDLFPAILVLPGAPEEELLDAALWRTLATERVTASLDASGNVSHSRDTVQPMTKADLMPPPGYGRLLVLGQAGHLVRLPDITGTNLLD